MELTDLIELARANHLCNLTDNELKLYQEYMPKIKQIEQEQNFKTPQDEDEYFETQVPYDLFKVYYCLVENKRFAHPGVTIDLVGLRYNYALKRIEVLLIKRKHNPFKDHWTFPGGFMDINETINEACLREVKEETNIDLNDRQLIRLLPVSKVNRDDRVRVITNPNIVLFTHNDLAKAHLKAGDDALLVKWVGIKLNQQEELVTSEPVDFAFDHREILTNALKYLKCDLARHHLPLVANLLGSTGTYQDVKTVVDQIMPNNSNVRYISSFRNKYRNFIKPIDKITPPKGSQGGASQLVFRFKNSQAGY